MTTTTAEICELLREARKVFETTDDIESIDNAKATFDERKGQWKEKEADARELIRELTQKVEKRELSILQAQTEDDYKRTMVTLELEKEEAAKQWSNAERTCEDLTARIQRIKAEIDQLEQKKKEVEAVPVNLVPKQKYAMSLYAHLTNIRWDYENEHLVKGMIAKGREPHRQLVPFELDPSTQSKFFIANYLWDSM